MADNIETIKIKNSDIQITIPSNSASMIDPTTGKDVRSSVTSKANEFVSKNPRATQSQLQSVADNSVRRAKTRQVDLNKANTDESTANNSGYNSTNARLTGVQDPTAMTDDLLNQAIAINKKYDPLDNTTGFVNTEDQISNFYKSTKPKGQLYQDTVGGSDLSVFYMAEVPMMEDVLTPGLPVDAWRKEIITFELDSVLSLSYSTVRERFPVRTLGRSNPKAYTAGPRTIAGSIAFAVFAEDVLGRLRGRVASEFQKFSQGALRNISNQNTNSTVEIGKNTIERNNLLSQKKSFIGDNISYEDIAFNNDIDEKLQELDTKNRLLTTRIDMNKSSNGNILTLGEYYDLALQFNSVQLLDSLPPFHLLIMGMNDGGVLSKFIIKNVCIVDENQYQGTSQPNIINKCSFVAGDIVPMVKMLEDDGMALQSTTSLTDSLNSNQMANTGWKNVTMSDMLRQDLSQSGNTGSYK